MSTTSYAPASGTAAPPTVRPPASRHEWDQAARLLREHAAWIDAAAGVPVLDAQPALAAELLDPRRTYDQPGSTFLVAVDGGEVCGTVGLKRGPDRTAELKRMFVRPDRRGRGNARRLLSAALDHARRHRVERVWLETLPGAMDPAIALYRSFGFVVADAPPVIDIDAAIVMTLDLLGADVR